MIDKQLVSVIIIFLNAERFIQEAIESVFAQTYRTWEMLLVDDGSSDSSTIIARQYAEQHPEQIRYLEHEGHANRGMSASRNLGIHHAKGEFVAFLDSDDIWLPYKLKEQVAILNKHSDAAMVYGLSQWWYSWTGKPEDIQRDFLHNLGVSPNTMIQPPALLSSFFFHQEATIPCPSDILVRRKVIKRIGGFEEGFLDMYEDQVFYAKICLAASVFASDRCWDKYRQHPNSCVSVTEKRGQAFTSRLVFLNWLAAYLTEQKVEDAEIWQALRAECRRCRHPSLYQLLDDTWQRGQQAKQRVTSLVRKMLPAPVYNWLQARRHGELYSPPVGWVRFGSLRRATPISQAFGFERGLPIDRYYIEKFLFTSAKDIRGHVLEIGDDVYTRWYGAGHVSNGDVLDLEADNSKATIVADLTQANHIPSDSFDCIIITQTLQFIYDVRTALTTLYRILKPGGVVLATVPGISQISRYDMERWGHFWSFTTLSVRRLFEETFPADNLKVDAYGNVLAATAFLYGLATQEVHQKDLDHRDPDYEVIITVRAVKSVES